MHPGSYLKGALDNFSLIPQFFSKKVEIFISLGVFFEQVQKLTDHFVNYDILA